MSFNKAGPQQGLVMPNAKYPPGRRGLPIWGYTQSFLRDPLTLLRSAYRELGDVFWLQVFGLPNVFAVGPEAAHFVLQEHPAQFSSREGNLKVAEILFGESVLYMDGGDHQNLRNGMGAAFHSSMLRNYVQTIRDVILWEVKSWILSEQIDVYKETQRIALEITSRALFSISLGNRYQSVQSDVNYLALGLYAENMVDIPGTAYSKARRGQAGLYDAFRRLVIARQQHRDEAADRDLLDLLVSIKVDGEYLSVTDVMDQLNTFLFAGYDTSSSTMAMAIWYLSQNPAVMDTLLDEIEKYAPDMNAVTHESLKDMEFLDAVVKEVLRLVPPVYFIPRMATESIPYKDYVIPKGWLVNIVPLLNHRLPEIYADPDKFDPDRFRPPREEHKQSALAFMPFGAGPKMCIGHLFAYVEVKLFLIILLSHFKLELVWPNQIQFDWAPSAHPRRGPIVKPIPLR